MFATGTQCQSAKGFVVKIIVDEYVGNWPLNRPPLKNTHANAPKKFLGNQILAYGKIVTYFYQARRGKLVTLTGHQILILNCVAGRSPLAANGPLYYSANNATVSDSVYVSVRIPLREHDWKTSSGATATYFQMYSCLANLQGLWVQRKFGNNVLDIRNITMETGVASKNTDNVTIATNAEHCICSKTRGVKGSNCQTCHQGYQRAFSNATQYLSGIFDPCKPCQCMGRTKTTPPICNAITGRCLNCRNGTIGFNCSECAAHVQGPASATGCTSCINGFYGLGQSGCKKCDCHNVGSLDNNCNKQSGQCSCRSNIGSLKCNQCLENYYNLTSSGCSQCDVCYGAVLMEVSRLRIMQSNLTNIVLNIRAHENSTQLSSFESRLAGTLREMLQLTQYLAQTERIQLIIAPQVTKLNATLQTALQRTDRLAKIFNNSTNISLNVARSQLHVSSSLRQGVISACVAAKQLQQKLNTIMKQMQLVNMSLYAHQSTVLHLTGNTISSIRNSSKLVRNLENSARHVLNISSLAYNFANRTLKQHNQNNLFLSQVDKLYNATMTTVTSARNSSLLHTIDSAALLKNARTMQSITSILHSPSSSAIAEQQQIIALSTQAAQFQRMAFVAINQNRSRTVSLVTTATNKTTLSMRKVSDLKHTSNILLARATTAQATAHSTRVAGTSTLQAASLMLRTIQSFSAQTSLAQSRSNTTETMVREVTLGIEQTLATARDKSIQLRTSRMIGQRANDVARSINSATLRVTNSTRGLQAGAYKLLNFTTVLITGQDRSRNSSKLNRTDIMPSLNTCSAMNVHVTSAENKAKNSYVAVQNASKSSAETNATMTRLINALNNIQAINSTEISGLLKTVNATEIDFSSRSLNKAMEKMRSELLQQMQVLNTIKKHKLRLEKEIRRAKKVQQQLTILTV